MRTPGDTFDPDLLSEQPLLAGLFARQPAVAPLVRGRRNWPALGELDLAAATAGAVTASGLPLRFVPAPPRRRRRGGGAKLPGPSYELRIFEAGEVQTRAANWHDYFNALAWMLFPRTKAALNHRQVLAADPEQVRTREQDRLAMLDEGGVILAGSEVLVLGHALMESLVRGVRNVRAMAFPLDAAPAEADAAVARAIAEGVFLRTAPFPVYDLDRGVIHAGRSAGGKSESRAL